MSVAGHPVAWAIAVLQRRCVTNNNRQDH